MIELYIWGAGKNLQLVYDSIDKAKCNIRGIIDSSIEKQGKKWKESVQIYAPDTLDKQRFDYIVISAMLPESIIGQCDAMHIDREKIICFWENHAPVDFIADVYKENFWLHKENNLLKAKLENLPYELGIYETPVIHSAEEVLVKVLSQHASLCRFGDGEFEMLRKRERPWFQMPSEKLAARLKEVLDTEQDNIAIAISNLYGSLEMYREEEADGMRQYLADGTRAAHMEFVDKDRVYYDAYVTRPYLIYKDIAHAHRVFDLWKQIFADRNIFIIEGKYCRFGVGNDLLAGAKSVKRLLCPPQDAFSVYDAIRDAGIKNTCTEDLVLISLGPTATVLAYDLAQSGRQAIDIGQLDNEYEWYLKRVSKRTPIEGKCVAEIGSAKIPEDKIDLRKYQAECVAEISG